MMRIGSTWLSIEERARRTREILESTPRRAVEMHGGYDPPSLPPPPEKRPSLPVRAAKGARDAIRDHVSLIKDVIMIGTVIVSIGGQAMGWTAGWFHSRIPSKDELDVVDKRCTALAASAASASIAIESLTNEVRANDKKNGQRWDTWDRWYAKQRRTGAMPSPKFGPKAEAHADVGFQKPEEP